MADIKSNIDIDAISKTRILASLADTFAKTTKAASRVSPEINHIATSHEMLTKLTQYIISNHSEKAVDFAEILENFGNQFMGTSS